MKHAKGTYEEDCWNGNADLLTCDHCGEEKCCQYVSDPYMAEIHEEDKKSMFCFQCFLDAADEI